MEIILSGMQTHTHAQTSTPTQTQAQNGQNFGENMLKLNLLYSETFGENKLNFKQKYESYQEAKQLISNMQAQISQQKQELRSLTMPDTPIDENILRPEDLELLNKYDQILQFPQSDPNQLIEIGNHLRKCLNVLRSRPIIST